MKYLMNIVCLLAVSVSLPLFARRAPVPLMQSETDGSAGRMAVNEPSKTFVRPVSSANPAASTYSHVENGQKSESGVELGVEMGILGRRQDTKADFLGMQAFLGGSVLMNVPVAERITLRPSVGYFYKKESTGSVSISQNSIEGGLVANYGLLSGGILTWNVGLSQRLQWEQSSISIYNSSGATPSQFYYRAGPATGISVRIVSKLKLLMSYEYTWTVATPARGYSFTSAGLAFQL